ncbi:MAG TPA: ABC transporter ATP-binding protein [Chitinispirillaceae bacterium]|nr:ABC transporter ATP-binding protein [Chitinispirillaceae bacterium]
MNVIELKNVSKFYRKDFWASRISAVTDLTISVKKGIVTGFVGPNGAGKTTTIKMIMGLVRPSRGWVTLYGKDAFIPGSRKGVAYLCEQPYFYAHLSVSETLHFAADLLRLPPKAITSEISRVLSIVDLSSKRLVKVKELSKGMQQRLTMAQALLGDPQLLILDEPMSGMDPPGRRLFRKLFRELVDSGKTIFFSTHVLDDIESVCDEVIVLSRGKLAFSGEVKTILNSGFQGTEMVVSALQKQDIDVLVQHGCVVGSYDHSQINLFLPAEGDLMKVQNYLFQKNAVLYSVSRRAKSMEELLYQKTDAGVL